MHEHGLIFDHNLHALRIVEDFEQRYAAFRGLNLTFEVREGIIKHSHDYDIREHPELAEYLLDQRPPLEAQLIDLTDEIAYNTADLDDGYEAHLLSLEQIREGVPVLSASIAKSEQLYPDAPDKLKFNEALKRILNLFVDDLITNTRARLNQAGIRNLEDVRNPPNASPPSARHRSRAQTKQEFPLRESLFQLSPGRRKRRRRARRRRTIHLLDEPTHNAPHNYQEKAKEDSLPA